MVAQVDCGHVIPTAPCPPGNVCCFLDSLTKYDSCALPQDGCSEHTLRCNYHDDCPNGQQCCGDYDGNASVYETECREICDDETMC